MLVITPTGSSAYGIEVDGTFAGRRSLRSGVVTSGLCHRPPPIEGMERLHRRALEHE